MARRGVYGLQDDPGTYPLQGAADRLEAGPRFDLQPQTEAPAKLNKAFSDLLETELKLEEEAKKQNDQEKQKADALRLDIDLQKQYIDGLQSRSKAIRDTIHEGEQAASAFRTAGGTVAAMLRGDLTGALQGVAGLLTQAAARKAGTIDAVAADAGKSRQSTQAALTELTKGQGAAAGGAKAVQSSASGGGTASAAAGAAEATGGLAAGLASMATVAAGAAVAVSAVTKVMLDLAKAANPVQAERFNMALEDAQAVLGKVFVPILETATDGVRLLGDVLTSILPDVGEVRAAIAPWTDALKELRQIFADLMPVIKPIMSAFVELVGIYLKVMTAINPVIMGLRAFRDLLASLGLIEKGKGELKSSVGAAVRPATYTSVDEYIKQARAAAFSIGGEEKKTPAESILGYMPQITELLKIIAERTPAGAILGAAASGVRTAASSGVLGPAAWLLERLTRSTDRGIPEGS